MPSLPPLQQLLEKRILREALLRLGLLFLLSALIMYSISSIFNMTPIEPGEHLKHKFIPKTCRNQTVTQKAQSWPKIIHQTWKDQNVPDKFKIKQESCKLMNPEYEYKLWTDADLEALIKEHYPWFLKTYLSYPYTIERIDSARLFIVYHYGGVYLDIDIECKVRFSTILTDVQRDRNGYNAEVVLAHTDPFGITNNMLISQPRASFLEFVTHRLLETNGYYFSPHWTVMFSTGPFFILRSYQHYICKDEIHLISTYNHSSVYFNHVQAGTWHNWDGPFIGWFDYHGRTLLKVLGIGLLLVLVVTLVRRYR